MLKLLAFLLASFAAVARVADAAQFDPFVGSKPLAVLIDADEGLLGIDIDLPRVAIYENGDVVFAKKVGVGFVYHVARLDREALAALEDRWRSLVSFTPRRRHYSLSSWTHESIALLFLRSGNRSVAISAYGLRCAHIDRRRFDRLPPADLINAVRELCALDFAQSKEWTPRFVEATFWEDRDASGASIRWPDDWPSLGSLRAKKGKGSYSIFLDGDQLSRLRSLLAKLPENGTVELAGKKWAVSYRMAFPHQPIWDRAFSVPPPDIE